MARAPRVQFSEAFYHVYNRGAGKMPIVYSDRDRKTFFKILSKIAGHYAIRLFAYCLMDNHFHLFLQTRLPNLSAAMQRLQSEYTHSLNTRSGRVGTLFESRYKSPLVDTDSYALALVRYIHRNPLEAGMVERMEDYPWSSYGSYTGKHPAWNGLDPSFILGQFSPDTAEARHAFKKFNAQRPPDEETKSIEKMHFCLGSLEFWQLMLQKASDAH